MHDLVPVHDEPQHGHVNRYSKSAKDTGESSDTE